MEGYEFLEMSEEAMNADAQKFAQGLEDKGYRSDSNYQANTDWIDALQNNEADAIESATKFAEGLKDRGYQMDETYKEAENFMASLHSQDGDE